MRDNGAYIGAIMDTIEAIGGPAAWTGAVLEREGRWIRYLDNAAVAAIDRALATVQDAQWQELTSETFDLGAFAAEMAGVAQELEHGRGIVLLRGLPVERYSPDDLKKIHFGFACHLGTPVYQSAKGELIGEITDEGAAALTRGTLSDRETGDVFLSSRARVQTTGQLRFHTDRCDVVTLLCVRPATRGGVSRILSAIALHDAMLERRPDLLAALYQDIPRSRLGEEKGGEDDYYMLPIFAQRDGYLTTHYSRTYIEAGQKLDHVPRMTDAQWQAIEMLHAVGEELCLQHAFRPGDIQYLNNHVLYHGRTAYEDGGGQRLLYRIWLAMPNSRPLPDSHAVLFGATEAGAVRGGILQPDGTRLPPDRL